MLVVDDAVHLDLFAVAIRDRHQVVPEEQSGGLIRQLQSRDFTRLEAGRGTNLGVHRLAQRARDRLRGLVPACTEPETHAIYPRRLLWLCFATRAEHLKRTKGGVALPPANLSKLLSPGQIPTLAGLVGSQPSMFRAPGTKKTTPRTIRITVSIESRRVSKMVWIIVARDR
jgi:hypothetical protein